MEIKNTQSINIDLKKASVIPLPQFIQNDTNVINFKIKNNGEPVDLSKIGRTIINYRRPDKEVISRILDVEGDILVYHVGLEEMERPGMGEIELQFYNADNTQRLSTKRFKIHLLAQIGTDHVLADSENLTALQQLLVEVQDVNEKGDYAKAQGDYAKEQADTAKTNWLSPVDAFADIETSYPTPSLGDTVQVLSNGYVYRYNGAEWIYTQGYSATALADVNANLAQTDHQSINLLAPTKKKRQAIFSIIADDARLSDYTELLPVVRDKKIPLGIAVITSTVGTSSMSWSQIKEFADLGCEILSHTHNHYPLAPDLTEEQIRYELETSRNILKSKGYRVDGFVYPQNVQNTSVRKIVREYYRFAFGKAGRSGVEGLNYPAICNYVIGRTALGSYFDTPQPEYTNQDTKTLDYYKERVDKAITNNGWLTFVLHSGETSFDATQQQYLRDIIDYIRSKGCEIVSPSEGFERYGNIIEIGDYSEPFHHIVDCDGKEDSYDMGVEITDKNEISLNTRHGFIRNSSHRIFITPVTTAFAQSEGFPDGVAGILTTYGFDSDNAYRYQEYEQVAGRRKTYRRNVDSEYNWLPWEETTNLVVFKGYNGVIASDLITDETKYARDRIQYNLFLNSDAAAAGFPEGLGGILKTFNLDGTYHLRYQEYQLNSYSGSTRRTYRRYVNSDNTWTDWVISDGNMLSFNQTIASKVIPANSTAVLSVSGLTGKSTRDVVTVMPKFTIPTGLIVSVPYSTANTSCGIPVGNLTGTDITLPQGSWDIIVIKQ